MSNIVRARLLIETTRNLAPFLNEKEISDIGKILLEATKRMEKESGDNDGQASGE